jgi:hypothetical protein
MKKAIVTAVALTLAATGAFAQTNQVLSRNAVGYVKVDILASNFYLASIPFNAFSNTIPGIFGAQLVGGASFPLSDNVFKFDANSKSYIIFWKTLAGVWQQVPTVGQTTNTLRPGEAFFIQNRRATNQSVFLMGEVPDAITGPTQFVGIVTGLQFAAYGYPTEVAITNLAIGDIAKRGPSFPLADNIRAYNPLTKGYDIYWAPSVAGASWRKVPQATNTPDKLAVGQGFFYNRTSGSVVWVESKPYTWP